MWNWDQGRLKYFEFTNILRIADFINSHDFLNSDRNDIESATQLEFSPKNYSPWRNYARVLKLCLLAVKREESIVPTNISSVLSIEGAVTCDEFFHFIIQASTEPSPALSGYTSSATFRYPLLFSLKYLLAKAAINLGNSTSFDEIISAYQTSHFSGSESDEEFISLFKNKSAHIVVNHKDPKYRQTRESLLVISQISYLHTDRDRIYVSLDQTDARDIFLDMSAITGPFLEDSDQEIERRASLFSGGSIQEFTYQNSVVSEALANGFSEGSKSKQTHIVIERNRLLRSAFFRANPTTTCDVCRLNTKRSYPWTEGILDLHHILPLSSGTRSSTKGTLLEDLKPVCPTCHRAVHRYYDTWLKRQGKNDFKNRDEAIRTYESMKLAFPGYKHG